MLENLYQVCEFLPAVKVLCYACQVGPSKSPIPQMHSLPIPCHLQVHRVRMCLADLSGLLRHMSTPGAFAPGNTAKVHCFVSVNIAQQPSRQVLHITWLEGTAVYSFGAASLQPSGLQV